MPALTETQITTLMEHGASAVAAGRDDLGLTREGAIKMWHDLVSDPIWLNNIYQVNVRPVAANDWPAMIHLSIKRRDKQPIGVEHFRDFQRIKNELVGPDHEAVELYPAEDSLIDSANQYHLWALADSAHRFPFGFRSGRLIIGKSEGGAVQRPFT